MENGECKFIGFGPAWSPKGNQVQPPASRKKLHILKTGESFPLALDQRALATGWNVDLLAAVLILLDFFFLKQTNSRQAIHPRSFLEEKGREKENSMSPDVNRRRCQSQAEWGSHVTEMGALEKEQRRPNYQGK